MGSTIGCGNVVVVYRMCSSRGSVRLSCRRFKTKLIIYRKSVRCLICRFELGTRPVIVIWKPNPKLGNRNHDQGCQARANLNNLPCERTKGKHTYHIKRILICFNRIADFRYEQVVANSCRNRIFRPSLQGKYYTYPITGSIKELYQKTITPSSGC